MGNNTEAAAVNIPLRFEDYEKDAKRAASRLFRKAYRGGVPGMELDDIYSNVCMTWMRCKENYDPSLGFPFRNYFLSAVSKNYGMFVREHYDDVRANSVSFDMPLGEDSGSTIGDMIEDDSVDIEGLVSKRERIMKLGDRFPLLASMLELIVNPPVELQREIEACQEYFQTCERLGYSISQQPKMLTFSLLQKIFGFNWRQRLRLLEELQDASNFIS